MATTKSRNFPIDIKVTAALINDVHTDVAVLGFANCIVVLITQLASVGSIIQAVTSRVSYNDGEFGDLSEVDDVPVDVKFVLGNANASKTASLYQICAMHVAQNKHRQNPLDTRPLVLGIGLKMPAGYNLPQPEDSDDGSAGGESSADSSIYAAVQASLPLVDECRVW